MLSDMSASQSRSHRSVFGGSWLLGRGSIVALITLSIITSFGISDLTARSGIEPSSQSVNRILKGDRSLNWPIQSGQLPYTGHDRFNTPLEIASGSRLPVGCESLVSALAHSQLARIARQLLIVDGCSDQAISDVEILPRCRQQFQMSGTFT